MLKTTTPPVFLIPSMANTRMPVANPIGIVTLNLPYLSAIMFGIVRPNTDAAFRIASCATQVPPSQPDVHIDIIYPTTYRVGRQVGRQAVRINIQL